MSGAHYLLLTNHWISHCAMVSRARHGVDMVMVSDALWSSKVLVKSVSCLVHITYFSLTTGYPTVPW